MHRRTAGLTRRNAICGLMAAGGLVIAGCGRSATPGGEDTRRPRSQPLTGVRMQPAMTVYRDPGCGCCTAWAQIARRAGHEVTVVNHPDMPAIKRQHGVPEALRSCHTTLVAGYAIEGHVPLADVQRLLAKRPAGLKGIAVPGMPRGSPGMESPDGKKDAFQVMAFDASGRITPFSA